MSLVNNLYDLREQILEELETCECKITYSNLMSQLKATKAVIVAAKEQEDKDIDVEFSYADLEYHTRS